MGLIQKALIAMALTTGTGAYATCVQTAMRVGDTLGGAFCDETKRAFANDLVVFPRMTTSRNMCPNGAPFDFIDVMTCKRAMANAVSSDRFCNRIFRQNNRLNYAGHFMTPRARFTEYQSRCNS